MRLGCWRKKDDLDRNRTLLLQGIPFCTVSRRTFDGGTSRRTESILLVETGADCRANSAGDSFFEVSFRMERYEW